MSYILAPLFRVIASLMIIFFEFVSLSMDVSTDLDGSVSMTLSPLEVNTKIKSPWWLTSGVGVAPDHIGVSNSSLVGVTMCDKLAGSSSG